MVEYGGRLMKTIKIYGAPGTGKTTRLLDILEGHLKDYNPERIAYITHTKAAINEAKERVRKIIPGADKLEYFKTIHAICFNEVGLSKHLLMSPRDYLKFGNSIGIKFSSYFTTDTDMDGLPWGYSSSIGNKILNMNWFAKANLLSYTDVRNMWPISVSPGIVKEVIEGYKKYKEKM